MEFYQLWWLTSIFAIFIALIAGALTSHRRDWRKRYGGLVLTLLCLITVALNTLAVFDLPLWQIYYSQAFRSHHQLPLDEFVWDNFFAIISVIVLAILTVMAFIIGWSVRKGYSRERSRRNQDQLHEET